MARGRQERVEVKLTGSAAVVNDCLRISGKRGNRKDYVVLQGRRLHDGARQTTAEVLPADPVVPDDWQGSAPGDLWLVHKRELKDIVGPVVARRYWNPRLRRRTIRRA